MAVTCDGLRGGGANNNGNENDHNALCGRPATTQLNLTVRSRIFAVDLCDECAQRIEREVTRLAPGARIVAANVDYKQRNAYKAASGVSFTAEEARAWLVERNLASSRGRLSREQLKAYADAH